MTAETIHYLRGKEVDTRDVMSSAKFYEGYSRWNDKKGRYETWDEAVDRVMDMHKEFYADKITPELTTMMNTSALLYKQKYILGAQRALQFGGEQIIKHQMRMYNCTSTYADREEFFNEAFYILLCGAGAGFSVQFHHVAKIAAIVERKKQAKIHAAEDSIEGWADCLAALMSSFFVGGGIMPEYEGRRVYFDLTKIRPKGSPISGGFKAPGPEPLRKALDLIEHLLQGLVLRGITKLRPIHVYDIVMHFSDAVLAGGVRRSATICLFSKDDEEMLSAKTGDWMKTNPQRARSNNSALLVRDDVTREEFATMMDKVKSYGEPGFVFVNSTEHTVNPCFSGDTIVAVADGRNAVTIADLAEQNKPFSVYSARLNNVGEWKSEIQTAIAFKTAIRKTIKLTLSDGSIVECTPEHKLAIPRGHYIQAKDALNVELEGFHTHKDKNYRIINSFTNGYAKQHRLIWEYNNGKIPKGSVIDHIVSRSPDFIDNLQMMTKKDHDVKTGYEVRGKNNAVHFIEDTEKWKQNLSNKAFLEGNPNFNGITNEELITNAKKLLADNKRITFAALKKMDLRTPATFSKNRFGGSIKTLIAIAENLEDYVEPNRVHYQDNTVQINKRHNPIVIKIEDGSEQDVYDLKVENNSNFYILTKGDDSYMNSTGILVHNCVEIGMLPVFEGKSGWQGCNLTEINGNKAKTKEEFLAACYASAILGTLQAGYTDFTYLNPVSKQIFDREALLGCSITGWMNSPDILFDADILKEGAELILKTNKEVAAIIGINPAARATCSKPSGNASVLLQTLSGVNGEPGARHLRHVQMNKDSDIAKVLLRTNPYMMEESVWSAARTDYAIAFPVIAPHGSIMKKDLFGVNLLERVAFIQKHWVENGTDESLCVDPTVRHNVSNTVSVQDGHWDEVEDYIFEHRYEFSGISLLGALGDKAYNQAPETVIYTEDQILRNYGRGAMFASGLIVDTLNGFSNLWDATHTAQYNGNSGGGEAIDKQADWIRRFHKFSDNYFNGDRQKAEYCLKDVYNLHKWTKIQQNLTQVDFEAYSLGHVEIDIDQMGAQACVGGACAI